jgi:hypothetical protein
MATLWVLAAGHVNNLGGHKLVEMVINRQRGWGGGSTGFVWLTVILDQGSDGRPFMTFDMDVGWAGQAVNPKTHRVIHWNAAASELEWRYLEPYFPDVDLDQNNTMEEAEYAIICSGLVPGQKLLFQFEHSAWSDGIDYDSEFSADLIYASPGEIQEGELARLLDMDYPNILEKELV